MVSLLPNQQSILVGMILGDGYLQKTGKNNARLRLEHGAKQKDYLLWKVKKLQKLFQGKPKFLRRIHPLSKKKYSYWRCQSQSTPLLGKLRTIFYQDHRKIIPPNIEEYLTPAMLAVWYMDDGYYYQRDKCSYLYLGNVNKIEAEYISEAILKLLALKTRVLKKKKGYAVYFTPPEVIKLKTILKDHIIPYFNYKFPS